MLDMVISDAAKSVSPSVLFIDEIDSIGSERTIPRGSNCTANQLLSVMDGFKKTDGVVVLGATNKKYHLDE